MSVTIDHDPVPTRRAKRPTPLQLADYLTPDQQAALREQLQRLLKRRKRIEISLQDVERISVGNLELLIAAVKEARDAGKTLKLTAAEPTLENQLGLIGATELVSEDA